MTENKLPPKAFMSYCWSSENVVLDLATRLTSPGGVNVRLDKWHLREGQDSITFMEEMVTDPTITKVIIATDKLYVEKADGRNGGVGTETQIISPEVYSKRGQTKFVVVALERDDKGSPCVPTYYKGKIYIDLSDPARYLEEYEKLLRWLHDKPLHVAPEISKRPAFLDDSQGKFRNTTLAYERALDAVRNGKSIAVGSVQEYFDLLASNLEHFRIKYERQIDFDELVVNSIAEFLPYRDEFVNLVKTIALNDCSPAMIQKIHRFFERAYRYTQVPEGVTQWNDLEFENFKFIVHELLLYTVAALIDHERFIFVDALLKRPFYYEKGRNGESTIDYGAFRSSLHALDQRNKRLNLGRFSVHADLLKQRSSESTIKFTSLMQADLVLFVRDKKTLTYRQWWPDTLVYASEYHPTFEIFARAKSVEFFDEIKVALDVKSAEELRARVKTLRDNRRMPEYSFRGLDMENLMNLEKLGSLF